MEPGRGLSRRHCLSLVRQHLAALASPDSETGTGACGLWRRTATTVGHRFSVGSGVLRLALVGGGIPVLGCCCAIDMAIDELGPGQVRVVDLLWLVAGLGEMIAIIRVVLCPQARIL